MSMDEYHRALAAEPMLRTIERMVDAFVALAPSRQSKKAMCYGCLWGGVLKPLVRPYVGWDRAYPRKQAKNPEDRVPSGTTVSAAEVMRNMPDRIPVETDEERWMRSSEAWDAVVQVWLKRLEDADPANGHGIGARGHR